MSINRRAQLSIAWLLAAAVGGCGYHQDGGVVRSATGNTQIPVTEAFITPPPGGPAVIAVLENRYTNALAQDVLLENTTSTGGQNAILVRAYGPMGADRGSGTLKTDNVDLVTIRKEMRERFPGVAMEVSGLYAQNRYGPFSYATGRSRSGANCLYAWQRIAAEAAVFTNQRGAITWRLRVCDNSTEPRALLLLAYGLTVNGYFQSRSWNPFGDPPAVDPRVGVNGETVLPEQFVDTTVIAPTSFRESSRPPAPVRRRSPRPASRTVVRTEPPPPTILNQPVEGAAVVPRPSNTDLSEPEVERSNLPKPTSTLIRPRQSVPAPPATGGLRSPASVQPGPTPSVPRVIVPSQGATNRSPAVRVVDLDSN